VEIGLAPSALPYLIDLASLDSGSILRSLIAIRSEASPGRKNESVEWHSFPLEAFPGCSLGYVIERGLPVVLSVCETDQLGATLTRLRRFKNWHEHVVRMDIDGLQPRELGSALFDLAVFFSPATRYPQYDGRHLTLGDPHYPKQGSVPWSWCCRKYSPEHVNIGSKDGHLIGFIDKLHENARPWKTADARKEFAGLMSSATDRPQVVSRPDGERVYIVSEALLENYIEPLNAPEMVAAFSSPAMPLTLKRSARPAPRRAPKLRVAPPDDRTRSV